MLGWLRLVNQLETGPAEKLTEHYAPLLGAHRSLAPSKLETNTTGLLTFRHDVTNDQHVLTKEPLSPPKAKKLIRTILNEGVVAFSKPHALDELAKDGYGTVDAVNCLRAGTVEQAEWENGHWRYRVRTNKLLVVIQFEDEEELLVVTAWKLKK